MEKLIGSYMTKESKRRLFIALRAAGWSIPDCSQLLAISRKAAVLFQRENDAEIEIEADYLQLKKLTQSAPAAGINTGLAAGKLV